MGKILYKLVMAYHIPNKAVYTAALVAWWWAGAVKPKKAKKAN